MASGDFYIVLDKQRYYGREILNRYYYLQTAGGEGAEELANVFTETVIAAVTNIQSDQLEHVMVSVINPDNPADFVDFTADLPISGDVAGDDLPAFVAWGFKYIRTTRSIRNGAKRIAGVTEAWLDEEDVAFGTASDSVLAASIVMGATLTGPDGGVFEPQLARVGEGGAITYYEPVKDVIFTRVTTQNSRKR